MTPPIAHRWEPLEDLPSDWTKLALAELRALSDIWLEQKDLLAGSDALKTFNERLQRQWAIETGVIERIYSLDRGITELLIKRGIDSTLIPHEMTDKDPELVAHIIRDHEAAVDWLFDVVRGDRELSLSFIRELHSLMMRHQSTAAGRNQFGGEAEIPLLHGEWKRLPNNPTRPDDSIHEYCPPEQVSPEMERLVSLHAEHEGRGVAPEVEAAWLHHRFAQVHPFQDGNGRVARAMASLVFIRAGWFPLVVTRDERVRYISALEVADQHDLVPLVSLFAALERKAFVNALGIAREVLQEGERVDQLIASVRDMYENRADELRREWEHAKDVADRLAALGRERLESVADRLTVEVGKFSPDFRFFVVAEPNGGERPNWYRWQTIDAARRLDYFANTRDYSAWVRLGLQTEARADVLLAFTAIGREYRGLIAAALLFFRRAEVEDADQHVVDVVSASEELFQINYREEEASVLDRFSLWLDRGMIRALEMWRHGL